MLQFTDLDVKSNLKGKMIIRKWISGVLESRGYTMGEINILLCSDNYILELNRNSLGHNYYTDIITFDYCQGDVVSGDLFISLDTVLANSRSYPQYFEPHFLCELLRVMIHGILHLSGEDDLTAAQKKRMRKAERESLAILVKEREAEIKHEKLSCGYQPE